MTEQQNREPETWMNLVRRLLAPLTANEYVFSDIDGTIVDASERNAATPCYAERERLIGRFVDPLKPSVIQFVRARAEAGAEVILLTGRCRSLATTRQLAPLLKRFRFLRNSKFYNPTLSSVEMKRQFFGALLDFSATDRQLTRKPNSQPTRIAWFFDDREDVIQAVQHEFEHRGWNYQLSFDDGVFRMLFAF